MDVKTIIDDWLVGIADRWEAALKGASANNPPAFENLEDMPAIPGDVSLRDLVEELRSRAGSGPAPRPSAWALEQSVRAHPELFFELVESMTLTPVLTLAPWDNHLDGMRTGSLGDGPFCRQTPGEDNLVLAQLYRHAGLWDWVVFSSNEDGEDGKWPVTARGSCRTKDEASAQCDLWLLDNGYYLVEPTCEIEGDEEFVELTYGGVVPKRGVVYP